MDTHAGLRMHRWMHTPWGRVVARLLVIGLVLQPLWSVSQQYRWDPASLRSLFTNLLYGVSTLMRPSEAHAATPVGTFVVFGPEDYTRTTSEPILETASFSVLNPNTACTLRLDNGGQSGEFEEVDSETFEEVSSAVVTLNGLEVVSPNEFNKTVTLIEKPVTLALANTLTVEVRSQPGSGFTLQIMCLDDDLPTITATTDPPPNAAGWNQTDVTVSFECADDISGIALCSEPVTVTTEGIAQAVTGRAVDHAGNEATVTVTLNIDQTPPGLTSTVTPSPNGYGWNQTDVTVGFEAADALSGVAQVTPAVTVTTEGAHRQITGTATDYAGNTAITSATVNLDKTPPVLEATMTPLPNEYGWHHTDVTVSFTATDALAGVDQVTEPVVVSAEGADQEVTGTATDLAGNSGTTRAMIHVDTTPPNVLIIVPADGVTVTDPGVTVGGAVSDALSGVASVSCNTSAATLDGPAFLCELPLNEGANPISTEATDLAGNVGTASIMVPLDTTPPVVTITTPADGSVVTSSAILVTGTVDDATATVEINGIPATVSDGTFSAADVPVQEGPNTLTATATDPVGHEGTASVTVT